MTSTVRSGPRRALLALLLATPALAAAEEPPPAPVRVVSDAGGLRLSVEGKDFMVFGVNWDYVPIGQNYTYDLFHQPDDLVKAALDREMTLLRRMGANAIRVYVGMPARWIRYIHDQYGIWTVLNHTVGRYGYTLDGTWIAQVDYSDRRLRAALKADVAALVEQYRGTPGLLMWLLGNENNYGLSWTSFEAGNLPQGERDVARARVLYSLFGEIIREVKARDPGHPVAIANGDVQYLDVIAQECKGLDVLGANVYRGYSARDLFDVVKAKLGVPVLFTEFGADAFDAKRGREDDVTQARYLVSQWREIYAQSSGKGLAGNAIGGFVFQWSDGWWKYRQEINLDVHDTTASWANAGYAEDYVPGQNNMNEEWWGICAKGPPDDRGLYDLHPRTAYYALQQAFRLPPYAPATTPDAIRDHFAAIDPGELALHSQADRAVEGVAALERARVAGARLSFETYSTGGRYLTTPHHPPTPDQPQSLPLFLGFDHQESFYGDLEVKPTPQVKGTLSVNVLGNVAQNPIDEITYERRGRPVYLYGPPAISNPTYTGPTTVQLQGVERIKVYGASVAWEAPWFHLDGFFRTGHYHWGNEGDMFGLYREANYGESIDIYNADVPSGFEIAGKQALSGLKLAFGPQLWWGANPTIIGKYTFDAGPVNVTAMAQDDLAPQTSVTTSAAIPVHPTGKAALVLATHLGPAAVEVGGLWSGPRLIGREFYASPNDLQKVAGQDTLGARGKVMVERGNFHWYAQGAYMGLVAEGGPDARITYTGWTLKDSGSGNQMNALTGFAWYLGSFLLAPNFLWQRPLVGPGPSIVNPGNARNIQDDPFSVRANREETAAELMIGWDPTPATWGWAWDNDLREDAPLAASLDLSYRHQPTVMDAAFYFDADGVTRHPFPSSVPAHDLWEARGRVVGAPAHGVRYVAHLWVGNGQPNGNDTRVIQRAGADFRVAWGPIVFQGFAKFDDWGPYDYHRDFNLTFPMQLMGDLSCTLGPARWLWQQQTRLGVRGTWRTLDLYSNRYVPNAAKALGDEYEIRTYLVVTL